MTPPLVATGRVVFPYVIDGVNHKLRMYVKNPTLVGSTWQINSRTLDENDTDWKGFVNTFVTVWAEYAPSDSSGGTWTLEKRDGPVWTVVDTYLPSYTVTGTAHLAGTQLTVTLRDKLNYHFKFVVMEGTQPANIKSVAPTGGNGGLDALIGMFLPTYVTGVPPYAVVVSRLNQFMSTAPFVSFAVHYNKKMLKRRGLA